MPVPLNAFIDVVKAWFTEKLDYLINDSVPVKPQIKPATPSDIDLICMHPKNLTRHVTFTGKPEFLLKPRLLVECKGWFDYSKTAFMQYLSEDLSLLKKCGGKYFPGDLLKKEFHFFFLKEEVFNKGKQIFGSTQFQRVIIGPYLKPTSNSSHTVSQIIEEYKQKDIIIIEVKDILNDLFEYIHDALNQKKNNVSTENADKLRKNYALEMLHLVNAYRGRQRGAVG